MDAAKQRLKDIGETLTARRTALNPARHRTRDGWVETVIAVTGMDRPKRTLIDLETGARDSYTPTTLTAMESAYQLHPGTLGPALKGDGQLISDDGQLLYPPPGTEPLRLPEPDPVEQRMLHLVEEVKKAVAHLPSEAVEEVVSAVEDQVRLVVDAKLFRRGQRK